MTGRKSEDLLEDFMRIMKENVPPFDDPSPGNLVMIVDVALESLAEIKEDSPDDYVSVVATALGLKFSLDYWIGLALGADSEDFPQSAR